RATVKPTAAATTGKRGPPSDAPSNTARAPRSGSAGRPARTPTPGRHAPRKARGGGDHAREKAPRHQILSSPNHRKPPVETLSPLSAWRHRKTMLQTHTRWRQHPSGSTIDGVPKSPDTCRRKLRSTDERSTRFL